MTTTPKTTKDFSKMSAEEYFADLFTTGINATLEDIKKKHLAEAEEKFKAEADKIMKEWIFRMVQNFRVTRRSDPHHFRDEIIVQLPILKELKL